MTKMSWECEVIADSTETWCANSLRFASKKECDAYGSDLFSRWTLVRKYRSKRCREPVNYRWDAGTYRAMPLQEHAA